MPDRIGLETVQFGDFEADLPAGQLRKHGVRLRLPSQAFEVLSFLLKHPGEVVTREDLRHRLWPEDVFVDFDNNLNSVMARLREALNDSAVHPRFIETLPKRGYRFLLRPAEKSPKPRILIFPFDNQGNDDGQEYLGDGLAEDVIRSVAGLAGEHLAVIAHATAMHLKGGRKDVARIERELRLDYVVEGNVRRTRDRISVRVELIRAGDRSTLWSNRYEADEQEMFSVESAIAHDIVAHIGIGAEHQRPPKKPTGDFTAYSLYVHGRHYAHQATPEGFAKAQDFLKEAVTRDPQFALAYDCLAEMYYYMGFTGFVPPREVLSTGLFYALRAIEIDNALAETHALLGHFRKQLDYDWVEVREEMNQALGLNPGSPLVRLRYAMNGLMPLGYIKEAIAEIDQALESDPLSSIMRMWLGVMCWLGRQYDRGIEECRRVLDLEPAYYGAYFTMGQNYAGRGQYEEALTAHQKATELSGGAPLMLGWPGISLGKLGRTEEARSILERLQAMAEKTYVPPTAFAWVHLGLGQIDEVFEALNQAVEVRDHMMTGVKSYWFLDELRGDPRYLEILRKMNLEP